MKLRKAIYTIALVCSCLMCLCFVKADSIDEHLDGRAVNVEENADSIDIYARFAMKGEAADDFIGGTTYEELFVQSIREMWEGTYNGKEVKVHTKNVCETDHVKKITVMFNDVTSESCISWASKTTGRMQIYTADGRDGIFYDGTGFIWRGVKRAPAEQFEYTAGHEFGHILGLADVYLDNDENIRRNLETPMRSSKYRHAADVDYYILLKHKTWLLDEVYQYSDDKNIYRFIRGGRK